MARPEGAWVPDGRAKAIRADCEASLVALDGLPIDLYLVHAPDPRTPWRTTVRRSPGSSTTGLVRRVGVANVNRRQLDEALEHARSPPSRSALSAVRRPRTPRRRGGAVRRGGIAVIAHSPLGGPRGGSASLAATALGRRRDAHTARRPPRSRSRGCSTSRRRSSRSPARAARRRRAPRPGRRRSSCATRTRRARARFRRSHSASTTRSAAPADGRGRARDGHPRCRQEPRRRGVRRARLRPPEPRRARRLAARARRSARGELAAGDAAGRARQHLPDARRRAATSLDAAARHGLPVEVRLARHAARPGTGQPRRAAARRFGSLPAPEELRGSRGREPGVLAPTSQMRAAARARAAVARRGVRTACERVPFERDRSPARRRRACSSRAPRSERDGLGASDRAMRSVGGAARCVFDWSPDGRVHDLAADGARLAAEVRGPVETALCPHSGGPPICWCRPPLPGLLLAFARAHDVDPAALDPGRREPRAPDARRDARRALRVGLSDDHSNRRCRRRARWPTERGAARALPWANRRRGMTWPW